MEMQLVYTTESRWTVTNISYPKKYALLQTQSVHSCSCEKIMDLEKVYEVHVR